MSNRKFKFRVWRKLSTLGAPDNQDELIYEAPFDLPVYKDTQNGFHFFYFDTSLLLDKGTYYIGWIQFQKFVLNVGYDNNYRYQQQDVKNPNLFYNLLGQWESADASVKGVPMLRPLMGSAKEHSMGVKKLVKATFQLVPNPATNTIAIRGLDKIQKVSVYSMNGQKVIEFNQPGETLNISGLHNGIYIVNCIDEKGIAHCQKLIKNP